MTHSYASKRSGLRERSADGRTKNHADESELDEVRGGDEDAREVLGSS